MKKLLTFILAFALSIALGCGVGFAGKNLKGNDLPEGWHYNLNIIGVPHGKDVPTMEGSNRHTIFVPLDESGEVEPVQIYYIAGDDFQVLDGNATVDGEATIMVPHEYCTDYNAGCDDLVAYDVFAIGLGKPHDGVTVVTANCEYTKKVMSNPDSVEYQNWVTCEDTLLMGSFEMTRTTRKPRRENITNIFRATGCLDYNENNYCDSGDLEFRRIWIFNIEELSEYFWDYDANGLKLMQVRFYPSEDSGYIGYK